MTGDRVLRVEWLPGSDRLLGRCHCGAEATADDPAGMWGWLLAHPDHPGGGPAEPVLPHPWAPPAHVVTDPARIAGRRNST